MSPVVFTLIFSINLLTAMAESGSADEILSPSRYYHSGTPTTYYGNYDADTTLTKHPTAYLTKFPTGTDDATTDYIADMLTQYSISYSVSADAASAYPSYAQNYVDASLTQYPTAYIFDTSPRTEYPTTLNAYGESSKHPTITYTVDDLTDYPTTSYDTDSSSTISPTIYYPDKTGTESPTSFMSIPIPTAAPTIIDILASSSNSPTAPDLFFYTIDPIPVPTPVPTPLPSELPTTFDSIPSPTTMNTISAPTGSLSLTPTDSILEPTRPPPPGRRTPAPTALLIALPSGKPTIDCTSQPTTHHSNIPTVMLTSQATPPPSEAPTTLSPASRPTISPSEKPTNEPTTQPTASPSVRPTMGSTSQPTLSPSARPTIGASPHPTQSPSERPTLGPTKKPNASPSDKPTLGLTSQPTTSPSNTPIVLNPTQSHPESPTLSGPTKEATASPSEGPAIAPTSQPTQSPSHRPTVVENTLHPTPSPSLRPMHGPTARPNVSPSDGPTIRPVLQPTPSTSDIFTMGPTLRPRSCPSGRPTVESTTLPTASPSEESTYEPILQPSVLHSAIPTIKTTSQSSPIPSRAPRSESTTPTTPSGTLPSETPTSGSTAQLTTSGPTSFWKAPTGGSTSQRTAPPFKSPTIGPTSKGSAFPSGRTLVAPTLQPTDFKLMIPEPTSRPSASPSTAPRSEPTLQPTPSSSNESTTEPAQLPTASPLGTPKSEPSPQPTAFPHKRPSVIPTSLPTAAPAEKPTFDSDLKPTDYLSDTPTRTPASQPYASPSHKPRLVPTSNPSTRPTPKVSPEPTIDPQGNVVEILLEPTQIPLVAPMTVPTSKGIYANTGIPTGRPTLKPTINPSMQPYFSPTRHNTVRPVSELMPRRPTAHPESSPTARLTDGPTLDYRAQPIATPTANVSTRPTTKLNAQPTMVQSEWPISCPSSTPSPTSRRRSQPSFLPTSTPTVRKSLSRTPSPTFLSKPLPTRPLSTLIPTQIPTYGQESSPTTSKPSVTISSQIAVENLNCASFNSDIKQQEAFSQVVIEGLSTYIRVSSITNINAFGCDEESNSTISDRRRVNIVLPSVGFATVVASLKPENVLSNVQAALLRTTDDGTFDEAIARVRAVADGEQSDADFNEEESIVLVQSTTVVGIDTVDGEDTCITPIATPALSSAKFDNAGIVLDVIFSLATDLGGRSIGDEFDCDSIFIIPAVTDAICQWTAALQVSIDVTSASSIDLAETNTVTLIDGVLKNECNRDDAELCKCFPTNEASTINLESPDAPITVEFQAPQSTSVCTDLRISGDQSSGGAGQGFTVDWTVSALPIEHDTTREVLQALQNPVLSANENGDLSVVYSSGQLTTLYEDGGISTLLLTLELTNVFGRSDSGTISIDIFSEERPFVEIVGPYTFSRDEDIIVTTYGGVVTCDEARESASVTYEYDLLQYIDDALVPTGLESDSVDQTEFFLNAYTLDAGTIYALTVLVTDTENGESNQATADIQIEISALVANIRGGDRDISQRGIEELSAERSFDPDLAPDSTGDVITGAAAGLAFEWSCENVDLPSDTASCEEALESSSTTEETLILTRAALIFQTYRFTVIVSKGTRRASSSVQLTRTLDPPDVFIDGVSTTEFVNDVTEETRIVGLSTDRLILEYTTFAYRDQAAGALTLTSTWSVEGGTTFSDSADLEDVSRTALTVSRIDDGLETACEDDDLTWFKIGEPEKNCDWVAEWFHFRCDAIGDDGRFAYEACTYSCTNGCLFIRNQGFLVLASNALVQGPTYTFRLDASLTGARSSGSATISIIVAIEPRGGSITVAPEQGVALQDLFDIEAPGWTSENLPLEYQFNTVEGQILRTYRTNPSAIDVLLPPDPNCDLEGAEDSLSWYKTGEPSKGCEWVGGKPTTRCDARGGDDRVFAQDACLKVCACYLTISVTVRDSIGATTKSSTAAVVESSPLTNEDLFERTSSLISSAIRDSSYADVCNIIIATARTAPEDSPLLDFLVDSYSAARRSSRISQETIELYAACIDEILTNATALSVEAAQMSLNEVKALSQDAKSLEFNSDAAVNVVHAISSLLESVLFFPIAGEDEESRRLQVATATDASENVSVAIDALSTAIASVTFPDEEQTSIDAQNVALRTRRSSGIHPNTLKTSDIGGITLPSQQDVTYTTTLAELRINTHRLEVDGDGLTSDAVMRLGLTALKQGAFSDLRGDQTKETNTTAQLSIPRSPNATQAPTAAPLFENVTIVCPWNFDGFASAFCAAENRTITRKCNRTKVEIVEGCGETKREACVTWDTTGRAWNRYGCFLNRALSTADSVVCDCDVIIGPAQNATARFRRFDIANREVFDTYAQIFDSQVFGGKINSRRAKVMISALCAFAILIILLMITGELLDRKDDRIFAVGGPSSAEAAEEENEEVKYYGGRFDNGGEDEESNDIHVGRDEDLDDLDEGLPAAFKFPPASQKTSGRLLSGRLSDLARRKSIAERHLEVHKKSEPWFSRWLMAMKYKHAFLEPWALYSEKYPRWARFLSLGIQMLILIASLALEQTIEYPDPNCTDRKSQRTCRSRKTLSGRNMCQWSERTGRCRHKGAPSDSFKTLEHMLTIVIATMVLIPMLLIVQLSFNAIVDAGYIRRNENNNEVHHFRGGGAPSSAENESGLLCSLQRKVRIGVGVKSTEFRRNSLTSPISFTTDASTSPSRARTIAGRDVLFDVPAERQKRKYVLRQRLRAAFLSKHLVKEAELRVDDVIVLVRARHDEIRQDMEQAAKESTVISARRNYVLANFYRDFVEEWGYSNDELTLRHNVKTHILRELHLARIFYENLESVHDELLRREKLLECARICRLSTTERRIYQRSIVELERVKLGYDRDVLINATTQIIPSNVKCAFAVVLILTMTAASSAWLIMFGSTVGRKETYAWMIDSAFVVFVMYFLVAPFNVFLIYVAMPALIEEKLEHIPKINSLQYPWITELPKDALDYLLILKPTYYRIMPDPDDVIAASLRNKSKDQIDIQILEEIELDRRWHNLASISIGLVFAGIVLSMPIVVQETILDEVMLLAPLAAFALITQSFGVNLEDKPWGTVLICLVTVGLAALLLVTVTYIITAIHRRILTARDVSIKKHREQSKRFATMNEKLVSPNIEAGSNSPLPSPSSLLEYNQKMSFIEEDTSLSNTIFLDTTEED